MMMTTSIRKANRQKGRCTICRRYTITEAMDIELKSGDDTGEICGNCLGYVISADAILNHFFARPAS